MTVSHEILCVLREVEKGLKSQKKVWSWKRGLVMRVRRFDNVQKCCIFMYSRFVYEQLYSYICWMKGKQGGNRKREKVYVHLNNSRNETR